MNQSISWLKRKFHSSVFIWHFVEHFLWCQTLNYVCSRPYLIPTAIPRDRSDGFCFENKALSLLEVNCIIKNAWPTYSRWELESWALTPSLFPPPCLQAWGLLCHTFTCSDPNSGAGGSSLHIECFWSLGSFPVSYTIMPIKRQRMASWRNRGFKFLLI